MSRPVHLLDDPDFRKLSPQARSSILVLLEYAVSTTAPTISKARLMRDAGLIDQPMLDDIVRELGDRWIIVERGTYRLRDHVVRRFTRERDAGWN